MLINTKKESVVQKIKPVLTENGPKFALAGTISHVILNADKKGWNLCHVYNLPNYQNMSLKHKFLNACITCTITSHRFWIKL